MATIPFGVPFLPALVDALIDGRLVEGFKCDRDPLALADVTIYLPTRRAVRQIRSVFGSRLEGPTVLPSIVALADLDSEDTWDEEGFGEGLTGYPLTSKTERQLVLTGHILDWADALEEAFPGHIQKTSAVPGSPADAALMARSLSQLIDQVRSEGGDWDQLDRIAPEDLASHFALTRAFLQVARKTWPDHLGSVGSIDPGAQRDEIIRREAQNLRDRGSKGPVIAAGSTGSVPATAELLGAISRLSNGAVVLPGLDMALDEHSWASIGDRTQAVIDPASASHPQYGLKSLLGDLGVTRDDVEVLFEATKSKAHRAHLVSEALRPVDTIDAWANLAIASNPDIQKTKDEDATKSIGFIEAANEREEAIAIALILRRSLEKDERKVALITPDRALARRVSVELERWGIDVDDSAGTPLIRSAPGIAALLAVQVVLSDFQADVLLAWLKHRLVAVSGTSEQTTNDARLLERAVLRGIALPGGLDAIRRAFDRARDQWQRRDNGEAGIYLPNAARDLTAKDWERVDDLLDVLVRVSAPLTNLLEQEGPHSIRRWVEAHSAMINGSLSDIGSSSEQEQQSVQRLQQRMADYSEIPVAGDLLIDGADYPDLLKALLNDDVIRLPHDNARIQILGVLEARLQTFDEVILAGLNEGTWPVVMRSDAFLSRDMSAKIGLEPPERRIGLAAHDFAQALGQDRVWLSRSDRADGQPQVASRWVQRLLAYLGPDLTEAMRARGQAILHIARALDDVPTDVVTRDASVPTARPCPNPPLVLRPRRLSVTEIETLIRDPYTIYARHILKLRPFDAIAGEPGALERGNLYHEILERFIREYSRGPFDDAALTRLTLIGREVFAAYRDHAPVQTLWWPRFLQIADWFVTTEAALDDVVDRNVECHGVWSVSIRLSLAGRADRIDRLRDGTFRIADYKTGRPPSAAQVLHLAPQLLLEGLMVEAGAFSQASGEVSALDYYKLSSTCAIEGRGYQREGRNRPAISLQDSLVATRQQLDRLISYYEGSAATYRSQAIPLSERTFTGDYDHLARVAEWSLEDDPS